MLAVVNFNIINDGYQMTEKCYSGIPYKKPTCHTALSNNKSDSWNQHSGSIPFDILRVEKKWKTKGNLSKK